LAYACSNCEYCEKGLENLCDSQCNSGLSTNGVFADYCNVDAKFACKIPLGLSPIMAAPILCAGVTSYAALKKANINSGDTVLLVGASGGLGSLGIQYAKAMGLVVIATDMGSDKELFMKECGADYTYDNTQGGLKQFVYSCTNNKGAHAVICFAPDEEAMHQCIHTVRKGGTVVLVALKSSNSQIELPLHEVIMKGISVVGSIVGNRNDLHQAMEFAARGLVKPKVHVHRLADFRSAIKELRANSFEGRVVFAEPPNGVN